MPLLHQIMLRRDSSWEKGHPIAPIQLVWNMKIVKMRWRALVKLARWTTLKGPHKLWTWPSRSKIALSWRKPSSRKDIRWQQTNSLYKARKSCSARLSIVIRVRSLRRQAPIWSQASRLSVVSKSTIGIFVRAFSTSISRVQTPRKSFITLTAKTSLAQADQEAI